MKRNTVIVIFNAVCAMLSAQTPIALPMPSDAGNSVANKGTVSKIRTWCIDERYGVADTVALTDTVITSYMDKNPVNNYSLVNSWNGNLGSQVQSKLFFDRTNKTGLFFSEGYDAYTITPQDLIYFNTTTPYANLTYHTALPRYREQDYLKALFTFNANKYINIGGLTNLIYGRGQYPKQGTKALNAGFWGSLSGKRYTLNAMIMFNNFRNLENGGLADLSQLRDDEIAPNYMKTSLTAAASGYRNNIYFLNHKYSLGFERERKLANDSTVYDFVPVTSFIHTIKFENVARRYVDNNLTDSFYLNNYHNEQFTFDTAHYYSLKNTLAITLEEKFNRLLHFGLAAFVEHDLRRHLVMTDSAKYGDLLENNLTLGATLSKHEGKHIRYDATGQIVILGTKVGQFDVNGNIYTDFRLFQDTILLSAGAQLANTVPDYFLNYYRSNHFQWDNTFKNSWIFQAKARLALPKRHISLGFHIANMTGYTYFDRQALPAQYDGNIQTVALDATVNLKAWKFHFDNELVYQLTSSREVLPLPDFSFYTNIYYKDLFFKVLTTQIGVSCRYHTAYNGNSYMPATGVFFLQNETTIGNYPELNVYLNFHLKRMRFYLQYANFNFNRFGGQSYFLMPNYPLNPPTFQLGLSWNFYN
ncbi:MAG: putative porin [Prevotellaceae bacterium]|jgi:hypothetical protein|nr:putative porin [Prevotellaceae bacterium]